MLRSFNTDVVQAKIEFGKYLYEKLDGIERFLTLMVNEFHKKNLRFTRYRWYLLMIIFSHEHTLLNDKTIVFSLRLSKIL